ncbi:MAG: hypothetical protein LZ167_02975 [Thaumarchaeota archaeon]|jgi:hypothetical protein|nr:hypothetical protein [Candidatus Geocrenenecus arthurdayi]MCL7389625.1 hypothetical protein [Candidatus Geocrenenecus arthurdayi]MCL7396359.1 hypothetical protein [Candidatus Geocrenenecus arthurdayi]
MILQLNVNLQSIESLPAIIFLILGLILVFYGRKLVKIITFIVGGIIGAILIYEYIIPWLKISEPFNYIVAFLGFIISGVLAIALIHLLGAVIAGYLTYRFVNPYFQDWMPPLIIAVIVFAVVLVLFNKLLSIGTAVLGAILVSYSINIFISLGTIASLIIIIVLAIAGAYYQLKH